SVPFSWARVYGDRVYLSGHGPLAADGSVLGPTGKVGAEVSPEEAYIAARAATLTLLSSLQRAIGDLDRVTAWLMVSGMINVAPGFVNTTLVMNPCSNLLLELYGEEVGIHARTAIGVAQLPLNFPVVISAEVAIRTN
ncbi:MAG TPA: RidA family protein, partial [Bacteroidales bacterium]